MKVLILSGLFYPSKLGGPANTLFWLTKALSNNNIDVSVVTSNNFIDDETIVCNKWTIVDKTRVRYCSAKTKLPYRLIIFSIKELLKCDVLLLSSFFYRPNFFVALFAFIARKKIIWSPRGELFDSATKGNKIKIFYIQIHKLLFTHKVIYHATSSDERDSIKECLGINSKIVIIPNYMELPYKHNRICDKGKYLLYVGRIAPIKAIDKLLLGLSKSISFMQSEFKLLIAGSVQKQFEEYYEQLNLFLNENRLLKEKIIFLGGVEGSEKYKLYANAYFTFLVSYSENFGNVVIESLSQGTPVIASKGTPWQILEKENSGYWIDNGSDNIALYVDKIINISKDLYQEQRNNAYKLANRFDVYSNIDKWINVLRND